MQLACNGRWLAATLALVTGCSTGSTPTDDDKAGHEGGAPSLGDGGGGSGGSEEVPMDCLPGARIGAPEGALDQTTPGGIRYIVRTPEGYDARRAHPLLVVYSPRVNNATAEALEAFTGLGADATARGYVAVFVEWFDPVPSANRNDAATIRDEVAQQWCIDPARVYLSGHSDGGSMTTLYALQGDGIAAVAPSAAGIDDDDGSFFGCNGAIPAMVIHSADDEVFPVPSFGQGAADFWASCANAGSLGPANGDGCATYDGGLSEVQYCEVSGSHYDWYGLNQQMLDFFDRHRLTP